MEGLFEAFQRIDQVGWSSKPVTQMLKVGRHVEIGKKEKTSALASAMWPVSLVAVVAALWPALQTQWGGSHLATTRQHIKLF